MGGSANIMKKTILYRLFGIGSVPKKMCSALEREGIVVLDEGIGGRFVTKHANGPGKRYLRRIEGFSGWLAVTKVRVACYTYGKRQINISVEDPKIVDLYVDTPTAGVLSLSFESSNFHEQWQGVIVFQFATDKARSFQEALVAIGVQQGTAANMGKPRR